MPTEPHRPPDGFLSSVQVCRRTKATFRQLDYWTRMNYLPDISAQGPGSGGNRNYSMADVERVQLMVDLSRAGVSVAALGLAIRRDRLKQFLEDLETEVMAQLDWMSESRSIVGA